ncbi:hypothetical protein RZS08_65435, partial [Arthrospira platensis SPKY1]|nr:hypothetical protein [Arthrospira platensis SPKY1]
ACVAGPRPRDGVGGRARAEDRRHASGGFAQPVRRSVARPLHVAVIDEGAADAGRVLVEAREDVVHLALAVANAGGERLQRVPHEHQGLLRLHRERLEAPVG